MAWEAQCDCSYTKWLESNFNVLQGSKGMHYKKKESKTIKFLTESNVVILELSFELRKHS